MFEFRSLSIKGTTESSDMSSMGGGRLVGVLAAGVAALALASPSLAADPAPELAEATSVAQAKSWAAPQIASVVLAGLMGPSVASFRQDDALTRGELHAAILALGKAHQAPPDPARVVTMRELDAQLVAAAGLLPSARAIRLAATSAGLAPIDMIGTETVARLLGLRINHPQGSESLERAPKEPASRAEAAYSLAKLRALDAGRIAAIQELAASFSVPALTDLQREVLTRALRFVGFPYVFAGMSEKTQKLWSATAPGNTITVPGGFDCSGFVWRIYKLQPFVDAPALAAVLRGRTSYAMSGEVVKSLRIDPAALQPADVLFFGARGPKSKPSEVGHMGIYVGNGWFVHASSGGVTLQPLQGWYASTLAWARRPLAEAGFAA